MTDENRRAVLPREYTLGCSHRLRQRGQGILHGGDVQSCRLQSRNHFGPRGAVGEQPMHEYDVTRLFWSCICGYATG